MSVSLTLDLDVTASFLSLPVVLETFDAHGEGHGTADSCVLIGSRFILLALIARSSI